MAASFNSSSWWHKGNVTSTDIRGIFNEFNDPDPYSASGLTGWGPNINLVKDPRWGRNQEVPGEDPTLTSAYAAAFVHGLQGGAAAQRDGALTIAACCKHFLANSLESWNGHTRHNFDAQVPTRALVDYYLPAFQGCVMEGNAKGVMCRWVLLLLLLLLLL